MVLVLFTSPAVDRDGRWAAGLTPVWSAQPKISRQQQQPRDVCLASRSEIDCLDRWLRKDICRHAFVIQRGLGDSFDRPAHSRMPQWQSLALRLHPTAVSPGVVFPGHRNRGATMRDGGPRDLSTRCAIVITPARVTKGKAGAIFGTGVDLATRSATVHKNIYRLALVVAHTIGTKPLHRRSDPSLISNLPACRHKILPSPTPRA